MGTPKTKRAEVAARRAKAIALRAAGTPWETIAAELGYASRGAACTDVTRALEERLKEQNAQVDHLRAIELEHLERLRREVLGVLERQHVTVSGGKVVYHGDEPLVDDGPVLAAVDRLVKVGERIARLQGLDSPVKVEQTGKVTYAIEGVDMGALQ